MKQICAVPFTQEYIFVPVADQPAYLILLNFTALFSVFNEHSVTFVKKNAFQAFLGGNQ
jgi:hypothetical protein